VSGHDSRVSRLEGFYPDGAAREPCPACDGTGTAPSEAGAVRGLIGRFAAAASELGFHEAPPEPPAPFDEPRVPCGLCRGELLVTAAVCAEHRAEVAQATAVTMQRLEPSLGRTGRRRRGMAWRGSP